MSRRRAYPILAAVCALPRLGVLLHERDAILTAFTEKSDRFALIFVHYGTYGLVPGEPSAYTQPLYGWFLIPLYWIFGRRWEVVGVAQIALAVITAWLVYECGRRFLARRWALAAAWIATWNPYLIWHDVHVNREICDQVLAAAIVLVTLLTVERRSWRLGALDGVLLGLAMLGNTRLAALPVVVGVYILWRLRAVAVVPVAALLVCAGIAVTPWLVRNDVNVGCLALTTDARALWKANNANTYRVLASGEWIDQVPEPKNHPAYTTYTTEAAGDVWEHTGKKIRVNECRQQHYYEHLVIRFWENHPGEKAKLMQQAVGMLWDPRATETSQRPGQGSRIDTIRRWGEGVWMSVLYALAIVGVFLVPRVVAALVLLLLGYQTLMAAVFAGTTRYRIAWDFLIALVAVATLAWLGRRRRALP